MGEELDVLHVVVRLVGCAPMVYLLLVLWLVWVDAFEDTQTPFGQGNKSLVTRAIHDQTERCFERMAKSKSPLHTQSTVCWHLNWVTETHCAR